MTYIARRANAMPSVQQSVSAGKRAASCRGLGHFRHAALCPCSLAYTYRGVGAGCIIVPVNRESYELLLASTAEAAAAVCWKSGSRGEFYISAIQ